MPEDPTVITTTMISHLQWIVVVEKEASFKTLVEHAFHRLSSLGQGLIVTVSWLPTAAPGGVLKCSYSAGQRISRSEH